MTVPAAADAAIRLSGLDSFVLVVSVVGAAGLYVVKTRRHLPASAEQVFFDMCGIWTTIELILIAVSTLQQDLLVRMGLRLPEPAELIRSNGPLLPISLLFCAFLAARATFLPSLASATAHEKTRSG